MYIHVGIYENMDKKRREECWGIDVEKHDKYLILGSYKLLGVYLPMVYWLTMWQLQSFSWICLEFWFMLGISLYECFDIKGKCFNVHGVH